MQSERSSGRTILLVEDEAIISLAQGATLEKYGFAVLKALSGEQAIEAVSGNPNIDLVLMDIDLGKGIDGTEAATQILAFRDLPIVFLTSHSEREMVDKVRDITRYGYVLKSTGEFVLIQAIEMAFELFESHERAAASRDRYRSVVRLTEEIILRYDADNRCVFANDRAVDFYGVPIAELMGSDPESFMDPDQFDVPRDAIAEMKRTSGPVWGSLTRELTPTGWRIVEWNSAPIVDRAGAYAGFQATGRDITERELAERDLQIMGMALESAADGVVVADFDGVITYTNAAARAMWGYDEPDAVLDRPIDDFVADPDTVRSLFREAIEQGRTHGEFVARRADGTTFDAALTASQVSPQEGLPPRIVGSVLDVSKRKETEALLSTYRQAADSAEDMIVAVDRSGRYTFANRSFLDRHKLRIREAIGRTAWEVLGSDLVEETLREKVDACLDGEVVTFEMLRQVPSQGARWMSISYSPIRMHGSVIGALGILKDITDYKETQTRLTEQLVRSERLREIARETLAGAPAQQIIANTVRQLGHHFAELRVTYSTLDRDRILSIRASAQPSAMTDLTGFEVDLSEAAEYAQALRDGIPVVVADVRQSESLAPLREKIEASEVRALLDMPVVRSDRLVGVLGFGSPTPREWTDHETETLREIAHYLTLALEARADQKKLARKTREWETLFELIPDMLCVASPDGWFLRLNRAWEGTLGFTREELKSRPVLDFVHPDDAASTVREIERQDAGEHTFNFTNRYRTKYGEYRWLEWWASPVIDGQMYATARDITGRRDQEERIAGLLAERELIVKEAHHRMKNDLTVVRSFLSLQAAQSSSEVVHESLSVASTRVGVMASIYEQLYRGSNLHAVDAATFVPGIVADTQAAVALTGLEIEIDVEPRELTARLSVAVGILVNELITNAAKHAFAGIDNPRISVEARSGDNRRFDLSVTDNGIGFAESQLGGKALGGEHEGLGMTIVRALVDQHDGSVSLENRGGASVRMSFPLGDSDD